MYCTATAIVNYEFGNELWSFNAVKYLLFPLKSLIHHSKADHLESYCFVSGVRKAFIVPIKLVYSSPFCLC